MTIFDISRFAAAVLVYLVHFQLIFADAPFIPDVLATSSVSWFFMASGFILSYKYHDLKPTWPEISHFYLARIARVYPGYLTGLTLAAVFTSIGYHVYGPQFFVYANRPELATYGYPTTLARIDFAWAFINNSLFLQLLQDNYARFLFNPPMWSLANEMLFYLFFPLLIRLIRNWQAKHNLLVLLIACLLIEYVLIRWFSPADEQLNWVNSNFSIYSNPLIRCTEFLMGMLLFFRYRLLGKNNRRSMRKKCGRLAAVITLYVVATLVNTSVPYAFRLFFYLAPIIATIVWLMAELEWAPRSQPAQSLCRILGESSFTIYCFHWPILELAHTLGMGGEGSNLAATGIFLFAIIFTVGAIFSYYVERPIRRLAKSYRAST